MDTNTETMEHDGKGGVMSRKAGVLRITAVLTSAVSLLIGVAVLPGATTAQDNVSLTPHLSIEAAESFAAQPLTNSSSVTPLVMLGLAIDEKAYRRAYDDLVDVDGDGVFDPTYKDSVTYPGYFGSNLCYTYFSADAQFKASGKVIDDGEDGDGDEDEDEIASHYCSNAWSGNFLNWLTMTRIDLIRLAVYGGHRVVDTDSEDDTTTVIERAHVPEDSHAWVKIYSGTDIEQLMPTARAGDVASFCNVSRETSGAAVLSQNSIAAPLLRVAFGAFPLWSAIERYQCDGTNAASRPGTPGGGGSPITDLTVRVEVCDADTAFREPFCARYPAGNWKPIGVLQRYGEAGTVRFGMIARSYSRPRSGGQIRRNIGRIAGNGSDPMQCAAGDEIKLSTGKFCDSSAASGSVIQSMERLRISGYRFTPRNGTTLPSYVDCDNDNLFTRGGDGIQRPGPLNFNSRSCNSYGNPVAEILAEALRYVAGATGPSTSGLHPFFESAEVEQALISEMEVPRWIDPLSEVGACADCNLVMISNGAPSFDGDEIPAVALKPTGTISLANVTAGINAIGIAEGLNKRLIAGRIEAGVKPSENDVEPDGAACAATPDVITSLSTVRGICPAAPARDGSFNAAGAAYLAHTRDLRPDLAGRQSATMYAIEFDETIPSIAVPTGSGVVTITPSCQSLIGNPTADQLLNLDNERRQCSFTAGLPGPIRASDGTVYGRSMSASGRSGSIYVAWDEVPYGQTQENNAAQMITWCVGSECPQLAANAAGNTCLGTDAMTSPDCVDGVLRSIGADELVVRVETLSGFVSAPVLLGYSIAGANEASRNKSYNTVARPRINDVDEELLLGSRNLIRSPNRPFPSTWSPPEVRTFTAGNSGVRVLPSPLELASKYGSYRRNPGDDDALPAATPADRVGCTDSSWDRVNNLTGDPGADCIPDTYHGLRHPGQIGERLDRVIRDVIARTGAAATLRTSTQSGAARGPGAVYQAFYESQARDAAGREVDWLGNMQSLFQDSNGNLREVRAAGDLSLVESDFDRNPAVQLFFDADSRQTRFRRFRSDPAADPLAFETINDIRQLGSLWNASRQLASLANVTTQRSYGALASTGRYIFTFEDFNLDGKPATGELLPFEPASFGAGRFGVLNVASTGQATALVNWVRGSDQSGLRGRQLDRDGAVGTQRLGDIVNSQPLLVAAPAESYDLLYGDVSYADFFRKYRDRRHVVYVGANDGMLHAFNAGFRTADGSGFLTSPPSVERIAHPLGSELWAYVPFNLLPQLGFLAAPNYGHQWTMDGSPRAFDVRAFADDDVHPNGWGTLLVVGMRLGGGTVRIPGVGEGGIHRAKVADYSTGLAGRDELVTRSAYVVLDITDPEAPPKLVAELTAPNGELGLTTSRPTVAVFGNANVAPATRDDRWYLFFGNGPESVQAAASSSRGRVFGVDLRVLLDAGRPQSEAMLSFAATGDSDGAPNFAPTSFVGDPVAVDWDLNYRADALYFGSAGGSAASPTGKLFKIDFNPSAVVGGEQLDPATWPAPSVVLDTERPVLNAPSVTQDERGNRWVLSGTGRFLATPDRASTGRQLLFGVIDRPIAAGGSAAGIASLTETTDATVTSSGVVGGLGVGITTEQALIDAIRGTPGAAAGSGGWRFQLAAGTSGVNGAERVTANTALLDRTLFATGYTPAEALCADEGSSRLFAVNFLTGAPRSTRPALSRTVQIGGVDVLQPLSRLDLGQGLAGAPNLFINNPTATGRGRFTINLPTTTGAIIQRLVDDSGKIRSGEIDWRENHQN